MAPCRTTSAAALGARTGISRYQASEAQKVLSGFGELLSGAAMAERTKRPKPTASLSWEKVLLLSGLPCFGSETSHGGHESAISRLPCLNLEEGAARRGTSYL